MRKQLVIGLSFLALTGLGGVNENSVQEQSQEVNSKYIHFVRTCQNQTFEPLSKASLEIGLPYRTSIQTAGVHFIAGDSNLVFKDFENQEFDDPSKSYCQKLGFNITSCASGLFNRACPYNDAIYDKCCDKAYIYTASSCSYPRTLSADVCGGKHRCFCDTNQFPFASCVAPQIKGEACSDDNGTRYKTCVCPNSNNGPWGCQEYYPAPCNNVCKTPYPDNCHNRQSVSLPANSYCSKTFDDCDSKCESWVCKSGYTNISNCPWMRCWVKL